MPGNTRAGKAGQAAIVLSPRDAARIAYAASFGLDGGGEGGEAPAQAAAALSRLGYVQIDTISVVERAHH
ncbi:MAG TPA: hypothetical protein DCG47_09770, partial [Spirochaetaceae bacterium]|nr:hypothetical protein [Spirochaetaceae bacterium]